MTKFTRLERLEAAMAVDAGDSLTSVGKRFGMSPTIVRRSVKLYWEHGAAGFQA